MADASPATRDSWGRRALTWIDERFPLSALWNSQAAQYYAPKNFNFWYYFGSFALLMLVNQILTGILLTMHYKPDANLAFASVEYIMREVPWGWLIRYLHSTGASAFFIVVYLHMFRALLYGSFRKPRELTWIFGVLIFLTLMGEAFFGYLLPWGQMSYWGAQVIVNLFGAIPVIGEDLSTWIRGDYVVSDATLNRFFALHVIAFPLVLLGLVVAHLIALHETGSNNPDGVEIKQTLDPVSGHPVDGIPFHPYYTVKDLFGAMVFLFVFSIILFFAPDLGGYFLEFNNFIPADSLQTPQHIAPVWYFTPYYSILRATTTEFLYVLAIGFIGLTLLYWRTLRGRWRLVVPAIVVVLLVGLFTLDAKVWGVVLMGLSVMIFFIMPWLDHSPVKSIRYKSPIFKFALTIFVLTFIVLGYLGVQVPNTLLTRIAQVSTVLYFGFFLLMPWYSKLGKSRPVPERVIYGH